MAFLKDYSKITVFLGFLFLFLIVYSFLYKKNLSYYPFVTGIALIVSVIIDSIFRVSKRRLKDIKKKEIALARIAENYNKNIESIKEKVSEVIDETKELDYKLNKVAETLHLPREEVARMLSVYYETLTEEEAESLVKGNSDKVIDIADVDMHIESKSTPKKASTNATSPTTSTKDNITQVENQEPRKETKKENMPDINKKLKSEETEDLDIEESPLLFALKEILTKEGEVALFGLIVNKLKSGEIDENLINSIIDEYHNGKDINSLIYAHILGDKNAEIKLKVDDNIINDFIKEVANIVNKEVNMEINGKKYAYLVFFDGSTVYVNLAFVKKFFPSYENEEILSILDEYIDHSKFKTKGFLYRVLNVKIGKNRFMRVPLVPLRPSALNLVPDESVEEVEIGN